MDVFAAGDTPAGMSLDARVGGSPFNVAIGLARLAQPVAFLGGVSDGFLGERLLRALRDEGVHTGCVTRSNAPTTLGLVGLDARGVPSYAFYGEGAADRTLLPAALAAIPPQARAFHVGSYCAVVEPVASTLRALVEREHARRLIAYDPNLRVNVEPDIERWRAQLAWMLPRTHLLKVSDEDLSLLCPGDDFDRLAASWQAQGVKLVVITRGARAAFGWCASGRVEVSTPEVDVVDTVGAGDTFQAALLTGLAEQNLLVPEALATLTTDTLTRLMSFAVRAAAITCSRRGADLPRRAELV
jgi:fructokinase